MRVVVWEQCAGAVGAWLSAPWSDPPAIWVGLIGFMAGAVEIVARYKGDPRRALLNLPALSTSRSTSWPAWRCWPACG